MEKWEYRVEYICHRGGNELLPDLSGRYFWQRDLEKKLNELGAEGWELIDFPSDVLDGHVDGYALFKRKITVPNNGQSEVKE